MRVWRLSVAYIGPKSRTKRPRKTKIGIEVGHTTRDLNATFKVKRSKVNLQGAGAYCGGFPHNLFILWNKYWLTDSLTYLQSAAVTAVVHSCTTEYRGIFLVQTVGAAQHQHRDVQTANLSACGCRSTELFWICGLTADPLQRTTADGTRSQIFGQNPRTVAD